MIFIVFHFQSLMMQTNDIAKTKTVPTLTNRKNCVTYVCFKIYVTTQDKTTNLYPKIIVSNIFFCSLQQKKSKNSPDHIKNSKQKGNTKNHTPSISLYVFIENFFICSITTSRYTTHMYVRQ